SPTLASSARVGIRRFALSVKYFPFPLKRTASSVHYLPDRDVVSSLQSVPLSDAVLLLRLSLMFDFRSLGDPPMLARKAKCQQIPEPGMLIAFPNDIHGAHSELTLTPMADARGVSPDDMLVAVKRDVLRESDLSNDDPHSLARYGLQKLRADGQLSS